MPRHPYKKIPVRKDLVYGSHEVSKLVNYLIKDGKKNVARRIVYTVLDQMKSEERDPLKVLSQAIGNVVPNFEVRPRRLGGASYLVPVEVRRERGLFLALNWIINAAKTRPSNEYKTFVKKLYTELVEASQNQGAAVAKKTQTEKLAEANKAFAHLKW